MVKWGKKFVIGFLVLALVMTVCTPAAFAGKDKKVPPGQMKKVVAAYKHYLRDISGHWAEKYISHLNCKKLFVGYEDQTFKPEKPITHMEALALALRIAGMESESKKRTILPRGFKYGHEVGIWAIGYLALGIEKGILDEDNLWSFRPNQPAKRYEVAVYVIRALGLTEEAEAMADADLDFRDAKQIPKWARGYVALAVEKGLLSGNPNGMFQPLKPMKRAEMAVLLAKVDALEENDLDQGEVTGTIKAVAIDDVSAITVTRNNKTEITIDLVPNVLVFRDNKRAELDDLEPGDRVTIILNDEGDGILVEATEPEDDDEQATVEYEGVIKSINGTVITLLADDNDEVDLTVYANTVIKVDGVTAVLADLKAGQEAEIIVINGKVVRIEATTPEEDSEVEGEIAGLVAGPPQTITLKAGETTTTYTLLSSARIIIDDQLAAFADLRVGDEAVLSLRDGKVRLIEVERS